MGKPVDCEKKGKKHQFGLSGVCAMCGVKSGAVKK